jgi:hypothetical protein
MFYLPFLFWVLSRSQEELLSEMSEPDTEISQSSKSSRSSSYEDDLLSKGPRLEECTCRILYDEGCGTIDAEYGSSNRFTPQIIFRSNPPMAPWDIHEDEDGVDLSEEVDAPLLAATIILGDLFAMGLVPIPTMQTSTLYVAENLLDHGDGHLLYILLTRAASHLAPRLGVPFLQECRGQVLKNRSVLVANGYNVSDS